MLEPSCSLVTCKNSVEVKDLVYVKDLVGVKNDIEALKLASLMTITFEKN